MRSILRSSVGKKLITGITGLFLCTFVIAHLIGNLTLLLGSDAFNHYAHFLENLFHGWAIVVFEVGLVAVILLHVVFTVWVALFDKSRARSVTYRKQANAGGASKKSLSSRTMIVTGPLILLFIVIHVRMFKFGPAEMIPLPGGGEMRDLYALVVAAFQSGSVAAYYVAMMALLGLHLWHGTWSAFQSLGWANDRVLPALRAAGIVLAVLLAVGFLFLPIYIYVAVDAVAGSMAGGGGF